MITDELKAAYKAAKGADSSERQRIIGQLQHRKAALNTNAEIIRRTAQQMQDFEERKRAFGVRDDWKLKRPDTSEEEAVALEAEAVATEQVAKQIMMLDMAPDFMKFLEAEAAEAEQAAGTDYFDQAAKKHGLIKSEETADAGE